jgi:hypothetical protein
VYEVLLSGLVGALLGVMLGSVLSYYGQIFFYNRKIKGRKKFLATLFLNEIGEIKSFIDKLNSKRIDAIKIQMYDQDSNSFSLDPMQLIDLIIILSEIPYFSVKIMNG